MMKKLAFALLFVLVLLGGVSLSRADETAPLAPDFSLLKVTIVKNINPKRNILLVTDAHSNAVIEASRCGQVFRAHSEAYFVAQTGVPGLYFVDKTLFDTALVATKGDVGEALTQSVYRYRLCYVVSMEFQPS